MTRNKNVFYKPCDLERFQLVGTQTEEGQTQESSAVFIAERDRIMRSSAFRRLQAKTQVFMSGEYDFYRTRLTHSLEVAQIGRTLAISLSTKALGKNIFDENAYIDPYLIEAICFAHDIGHPPFGHAGERVLNDIMRPYGGFEGNAQTLRLLTDLIIHSEEENSRTGISPTRALMDGVMKYKTLYRLSKDKDKHFLYDNQESCLRMVFGFLVEPDEIFDRDGINLEEQKFKSIECQIMDWADDIAFVLSDLEDGVKARFLTQASIEEWKSNSELNEVEENAVDELLLNLSKKTMKKFISDKMKEFIASTDIEEEPNPITDELNRYGFCLKNKDVKRQVKLYKDLTEDLVFGTPRIQQLDHKCYHIIQSIFDKLSKAYTSDLSSTKSKGLVPFATEDEIFAHADVCGRFRIICDYIAGMSDGFAIRTYKRFFDPEFGSILDIV